MVSMLWNTFKWLVYAAAATAAILWLRTLDATVQIDGISWLGAGARPLASVVVILAILAGLIALLYHGYRTLWKMPKLARERGQANKRAAGFESVSKGMVALAAGDADEAARLAKKANSQLGNPAITKLITAQSAQMKGDETAARRFFTDMLVEEETRFLGLRGLVTQSMKSGRREEALLLAREAQAMQPKSQWALDAVFELETKAGNMIEAEAAVRDQRALAYIPPKEASHNRAVLLAQQAQNDLAAGDSSAAISKAKSALSLDPSLTATRLVLPKAQLAAGRGKAAASSLEKAWKAGPQEEMIALYLDARQADDERSRKQALEKLASKNPTAALSNIIRAELAIEQEDWESAKTHLDRAIDNEPTERAYKLRAAVEQALTNDAEAVRGHLTKAINAKGEGMWTCSSCGDNPAEWSAVCSSCDSFDTVAWTDDGEHTQGMMPRLLAAPVGTPSELALPNSAGSSKGAVAEAVSSNDQVLVAASEAEDVVVEIEGSAVASASDAAEKNGGKNVGKNA